MTKLSGENGKASICGERIYKKRREKGYSQNGLAIKLHLIGVNATQKTISRIETGSHVVPDYELLYFSKVLGVSVEYLLGLEAE